MEITIGSIVIFHLVNGSHIIGKVDGEVEAGFVLGRPCDIITRRQNPNDPNSPTQLGFAPYLTMGGILPPLEQFVLPFDTVMLPRLAPDNIAKGYLTAVSGIQIAGSGSLPNGNNGRGPLIARN